MYCAKISCLFFFFQIRFHWFEITILNRSWGSLGFLYKVITESCSTNHGKFLMTKDKLLQLLMHFGTNACTYKQNLLQIFLHGDWFKLQVCLPFFEIFNLTSLS